MLLCVFANQKKKKAKSLSNLLAKEDSTVVLTRVNKKEKFVEV